MNQQINFATQDENPPRKSKTHKFCQVYGRNNLLPSDLQFTQDKSGAVVIDFQSDSSLQGYEGLMHGGVLAALLDTAMAHCLLNQGIEGYTGELNVRFRKPVQCNSLLTIKAWIDSSLPPLYQLRSTIHVENKLVCKAKAKFMKRPDNE